MTIDEAASELWRMYETAARGDKSLAVTLFGLKYADTLGRDRLSVNEVIRRSGIPSNYSPMVNQGRRLADYVVLKKNTR